MVMVEVVVDLTDEGAAVNSMTEPEVIVEIVEIVEIVAIVALEVVVVSAKIEKTITLSQMMIIPNPNQKMIHRRTRNPKIRMKWNLNNQSHLSNKKNKYLYLMKFKSANKSF